MESKDFHFPFKPYAIQNELMIALYKCIDEGKIGIFESPTGNNTQLRINRQTLIRCRNWKIPESDMWFLDVVEGSSEKHIQ